MGSFALHQDPFRHLNGLNEVVQAFLGEESGNPRARRVFLGEVAFPFPCVEDASHQVGKAFLGA